MRGGTGTTTVRVCEQAASSTKVTRSVKPANRVIDCLPFLLVCREAEYTERSSPAQDFLGAAREGLAHPGGGAQRAAEAVEVHADHVARLARTRVARHRDHVLAGVGVGDELGDTAAKGAQRAQRAAHAAALG